MPCDPDSPVHLVGRAEDGRSGQHRPEELPGPDQHHGRQRPQQLLQLGGHFVAPLEVVYGIVGG